MTETSRELSDAQHFIIRDKPAETRAPWLHPTPWAVMTMAKLGHGKPTAWAYIGDYESFICLEPRPVLAEGCIDTDPEETWTWVVNHLGTMASEQPMVDHADGTVVGSEADAKARAETMARMFGGMVET